MVKIEKEKWCATMTDHRELLIKYMMIVINAQGVDFLHKEEWSEEEYEIISDLSRHARERLVDEKNDGK